MLQVITDADRRGAQVFAVDLGSYFESRGLDVETVALWPGTSNARLTITSLSGGHRRFGFVRGLRQRMAAADVVIAHGSNTLMATALASRGISTPIVYRQISDLNFWAGALPRRLRVRAYLRRMSHAVALWSGSARVLTERFGVPKANISVIPNGVQEDRFPPATSCDRKSARSLFKIGDDTCVVAYVGALVAEKGVDLAIRAVRQLTGVTLLVVGDGPARSSLQELAARECPGRVLFAGALTDVRLAYWAADALVLASQTESMPAVVIEAGMCGLPVVAAPVGAISSMISDGETGFLVSPDEGEIASRLRNALDDPSLGAAARQRCLSTYSMDRVGGAWLDVVGVESAPLARVERI